MRAHPGVSEAVRLADERHHELVRRLVVELAWAGDLLDVSLVHHDDAVGDLHRLFLVVRDEHRRRVRLVVQPPQPDAQLGADARVERTERLVEQEHLRLGRERAGQRHALALAARQLGRDNGLRSPASCTSSISSSTRAVSPRVGRLRIFSPNAMLSRTVMCLNAA